MTLIDRAEQRRVAALEVLDPVEQAELGQYFTPAAAARIIADLPELPDKPAIRVLDPGAGSGMLSTALVQRIREFRPEARVELVAVEFGEAPLPFLRESLRELTWDGMVKTELVTEDFVQWALGTSERFDLVIQNPPYKKLPAKSPTQVLLRAHGIDVPNIYAAFLTLALRLLNPGGQLTAITPRSWMNGAYYAAFRRELVQGSSITAVHTFESRSEVFKDTNVLQEAIVVNARKGGDAGVVVITSSLDHRSGISSRSVPYEHVVTKDFIHVPASEKDAQAVLWMQTHASHTLQELGLTVSTGRVVDFRVRELLLEAPTITAVPLVNPAHVKQGYTMHPVEKSRKPQWMESVTAQARRLLVPAGTYVLLKRFSAKEERRRVVAGTWTGERPVGFDNKLNYLHQDGCGMDPLLARGMEVYLNSTQLDEYFRVFSGHTQVNATDLRQMLFPSREQLIRLGELAPEEQHNIDLAVNEVLKPSQKEAA